MRAQRALRGQRTRATVEDRLRKSSARVAGRQEGRPPESQQVVPAPVLGIRTVLGVWTSPRHPGVANAVRTSAVAKGRLALDVVVPYVLVVIVVTVSYVLWSKRQLVPAADGMKTRDAVAAAQFIVTE